MLNNAIKKDIFKYKQNQKDSREIVRLIKSKYNHLKLNTKEIEYVYKIARSYSYYYGKHNIPCHIHARIIRMYGKCSNPIALLNYFNSKYNLAMTLDALRVAASRAGISRPTRYVAEKNLKLKRQDQKDIIEKYLNRKTTIEIAKEYNCTSKAIIDVLKKHNIQLRSGREAFVNYRQYPIQFDVIDNEFKAYFLGFMLTDGYLTTGRNNVSIQLKDYDAVKFISDNINSTVQSVSRGMYRTSYYSSEDIENLERLGVTHNKSLTLQGPQLTDNENQYLNYIIRGIIDGDGWIRKDGQEFFICSASKDFIQWCITSLESLGMINLKYKFVNNDYNGIYYVRTALKHNIHILATRIYDKPYGMSRKYLRIHEGSETIIQVSCDDTR